MSSLKVAYTPEAFKKARALADKLMATSAPNEHWEEVDALTRSECLVLDSIAFECQICNHWFSVAERREVGGCWYCKGDAPEEEQRGAD